MVLPSLLLRAAGLVWVLNSWVQAVQFHFPGWLASCGEVSPVKCGRCVSDVLWEVQDALLVVDVSAA